MTPRLTAVQQDVLDRLRDGWELTHGFQGIWALEKRYEPARHVAAITVNSLIRRGLITFVPHTNGKRWTLA